MLNKLGGRKMAVGFLVLGVGVAFTAAQGDVMPGLLQLLQVIFGAYVIGNGLEHVAKSRRPSAPPAQATVDLSGLEAQIAEVRALAEQAAAGSSASAQALSLIIEKYKINQ